jgi:hypothetical protein
MVLCFKAAITSLQMLQTSPGATSDIPAYLTEFSEMHVCPASTNDEIPRGFRCLSMQPKSARHFAQALHMAKISLRAPRKPTRKN